MRPRIADCGCGLRGTVARSCFMRACNIGSSMKPKRFSAVHRVPSFLFRYAVKRVQLGKLATLTGARPAVTYATFRTASTSIHHAIRASGSASVKAHALAPEHLLPLVSPRAPHALTEHGLPIFAHVGNLAVRHAIIEPRREADFVVAVRDPIAVAASVMSAFRMWWPQQLRERVSEPGFVETPAALDIIEKQFFGHFPRNLMLDWLTHDMSGGMGWDPFAHDFDQKSGATSYVHGPWRLLVIRTELPDSQKDIHLRSFLNRPSIQVVPSNETIGFGPERKALIKAVHAVIRRHPDWVNAVLDDTRSRHFWSDSDLERMRNKWLLPRD